jgi:hypothetical protein
MQPTSDQLAAAIVAAASQELTKALDRIKHCLGQLNDEQIWQRESASMNSIGNLILHLFCLGAFDAARGSVILEVRP